MVLSLNSWKISNGLRKFQVIKNLVCQFFNFAKPLARKLSNTLTACKVSVFGVFLVRIFSYSLCGKIRTRKTPNMDTFQGV